MITDPVPVRALLELSQAISRGTAQVDGPEQFRQATREALKTTIDDHERELILDVCGQSCRLLRERQAGLNVDHVAHELRLARGRLQQLLEPVLVVGKVLQPVPPSSRPNAPEGGYAAR